MSKPDSIGARGAILHLVSVWHLVILLFLLIGLFAALKPDTFLTAFTFRSMANSRSINALVALAVMIPLAANRFDLSAASVAGIGQVLANGLQTQQHLPWPLACLIVLAIGATAGLVNGLLVTRFRIDSFIATLGTGTVLLGINQWYTGGQQVVGPLPPAFLALSANVPGLGVPAPLIYVLLIGVVLWLIFDYTPAGRYLYVIGDNPRAAALSGLRVDRWVTLAFIGSGLVAAFAGIILQAQLQVGQSTVGQELMLPAFTGALLGATAIRPGRPNVWGTILAVAVLAIAVAGLSQLGAPFYVEPLFNGGMLVLAVGLAVATQSRREKEAARREMERRAQGSPSTVTS
jgi:ribose transport system permease protein